MAEWAVFQNRPIIAFPATKAPMSAEIQIVPMVAASTSGYSGQLTLTCWSSKGYISLDLTYPPLKQSDALAFVDFFAAAEGQNCVFTLPTPISNIIPSGTGTSGYYQLTSNMNQYSVNIAYIYGVHFSIREVLSA